MRSVAQLQAIDGGGAERTTGVGVLRCMAERVAVYLAEQLEDLPADDPLRSEIEKLVRQHCALARRLV